MVSTTTSVSLKGKNLNKKIGKFNIFEGNGHPFGATVSEGGVNFSVYSQNATSVELLIFNNPDDLEPIASINLDPTDNHSFYMWHIFLEGVKPGMGYAYRVDGPDEIFNGHRFDKDKVLIDPYSKGNTLSLWDRGAACRPGDNLHCSMRSVVIDHSLYDWEGDKPLKKPMSETIVYEMHLAGFTKSPTSNVKLSLIHI